MKSGATCPELHRWTLKATFSLILEAANIDNGSFFGKVKMNRNTRRAKEYAYGAWL
jgi:hypothetical protein